MTRFAAVLISVTMNASTIPALAAECASSADIAASHERWTAIRSQRFGTKDVEAACRAYAASFYDSVRIRQAASTCVANAERQRRLAVLDSEIDAFNDLLAARCSG
jgi:hypothetical protein